MAAVTQKVNYPRKIPTLHDLAYKRTFTVRVRFESLHNDRRSIHSASGGFTYSETFLPERIRSNLTVYFKSYNRIMILESLLQNVKKFDDNKNFDVLILRFFNFFLNWIFCEIFKNFSTISSIWFFFGKVDVFRIFFGEYLWL